MALRTTAIVNLKGGVAKSITVINMAAILAKHHGKKVCIIDADSQCNTTEFFGANPAKGNLAAVLRNSESQAHPGVDAAFSIQSTRIPGIDILAGDDSLMDLDLSKVELQAVNANVLRYLVEEVRALYDCVLIDYPPAFNAASAAALIAADDVIIPIKLDAFSLRGMVNLMRQIQNMRRINPKLKISGVLPTMWYKDTEIEDAERQLVAAGLHVYHHIRRSDKVDKMTFRQEPLLVSSPNSAAGVDYRRFVREYVGGK
ncbi:MAG: ParA family protein [Oscillospiraceae bacterium]|nr:ParA family protein [Oscillospiraceae bacterium]